MLSAAASERGKRLSTKAQQGRSTASIDKLLPAGTVDMEKIPERRDFDEGTAGDAAWAAAVDGATEGFALCCERARVLHGRVAALAHGSRLRHLCGAGARHHDV